MEYHHVGIPTKTVHEGESYLEAFKMYVTSFDSNPYGVEWLRFDPDSQLPELVKTVPHAAYDLTSLSSFVARFKMSTMDSIFVESPRTFHVVRYT